MERTPPQVFLSGQAYIEGREREARADGVYLAEHTVTPPLEEGTRDQRGPYLDVTRRQRLQCRAQRRADATPLRFRRHIQAIQIPRAHPGSRTPPPPRAPRRPRAFGFPRTAAPTPPHPPSPAPTPPTAPANTPPRNSCAPPHGRPTTSPADPPADTSGFSLLGVILSARRLYGWSSLVSSRVSLTLKKRPQGAKRRAVCAQ